jgi:hypothetical protein
MPKVARAAESKGLKAQLLDPAYLTGRDELRAELDPAWPPDRSTRPVSLGRPGDQDERCQVCRSVIRSVPGHWVGAAEL